MLPSKPAGRTGLAGTLASIGAGIAPRIGKRCMCASGDIAAMPKSQSSTPTVEGSEDSSSAFAAVSLEATAAAPKFASIAHGKPEEDEEAGMNEESCAGELEPELTARSPAARTGRLLGRRASGGGGVYVIEAEPNVVAIDLVDAPRVVFELVDALR